MKQTIELIAAEIGAGAQITGCRLGPQALIDSGVADMLRLGGREVVLAEKLRDDMHAETDVNAHDAHLLHDPMPHALSGATRKLDAVQTFVPRLADAVRTAQQRGRFPLVLGGDHSCAVGTWSGVADAHRSQGAIGLIWIDAHLDSHTPQTSESQAPHGMPLAALLGHGVPALTDLYGWRGKVSPRNVTIIGARSYESGEAALLKRLGVRVIRIDEVERRGLAHCIDEAIAIASDGTVGYGVSFDVDAIDPGDAPGVGSPAERGLGAATAIEAMTRFAVDDRLLGFELVEYNPERDDANLRTEAVCRALLRSVLGATVPLSEVRVVHAALDGCLGLPTAA